MWKINFCISYKLFYMAWRCDFFFQRYTYLNRKRKFSVLCPLDRTASPKLNKKTGYCFGPIDDRVIKICILIPMTALQKKISGVTKNFL